MAIGSTGESGQRSLSSIRHALLLILSFPRALVVVEAFAVLRRATYIQRSLRNAPPLCLALPGDNDAQPQQQQVVEALHSLVDFHQGTWTGTATSFSVTNDVAAGVVQRQASPPYMVQVSIGTETAGAATLGYTLLERIEFKDSRGGETPFVRKVSLPHSNMDVDSVDASYSLDSSCPDLPLDLTGTTTAQSWFQFGIEHCIATSDNSRSRCFVLYGTQDNDYQLSRIVLCHEERQTTANAAAPPPPNALDLIGIQNDIDRLVEKITGNGEVQEGNTSPLYGSESRSVEDMATKNDKNAQLSRHIISLLEISSGIWNGDSVIRDVPTVLTSPLQQKGFGGSTTANNARRRRPEDRAVVPFCSWTVGVQKVAWRYMWNFGEEIRLVVETGRSMGAALAEPLSQSLAGSVSVNEGLSRRIPPPDRMVYIDWADDNVGFLHGSVSIQVPRYLKFDSTRRVRPLYTEFTVYQSSAASSSDEADLLPELICSKISRLYNYEGKLKQGVSSFFTLQRFGSE
jgi:hypothetical protein